MKSLILVGQIPYIGKSCLHWLEAEGLVNRRRRPNCPAGMVLVFLPTGSRLVENTLEKNSGPVFSPKVRTLKILNFFRRDANGFGSFL